MPARSSKASSWQSSRLPLPTAITSLWNTPASIASAFCCANTQCAGVSPPSAATRSLAARVCRAGNFAGFRAPSRAAPYTKKCRPRTSPPAAAPAVRRVWLAAPSSPKSSPEPPPGPPCASAGSAACTSKRARSAKIARSTRSVTAGSIARWNIARRFAVTRWVRPSRVSAPGITVAALAVHIALALDTRASSTGSSFAHFARISASDPVNPRARSVGRCGRSCGGSTPCTSPSAATASIFARPCSAAARGELAAPWLRALATLP